MKEILITSSVLIAVLCAVRFLFRRRLSRRVQYALWALVLARLLLPVSLPASSFSVMNGAQALTSRMEAAQPAPIVSTAAPTSTTGVFDPAPAETMPEAPVAPTISTAEVLRILWLSGMAVTAACFLYSNLRLTRQLRRSRRRIDVEGKLPVYVTGAVVSPCLFGLIRPAVYVTPKAAEDPARLRHVVMHELCHYRHGDHIWSALRCACLAIYWFDPLVWLAAVLSKTDGELACDEAAIRALGEGQRLAYGRTLLDMVAVQRPAAGILCAATTMVSGKRSLQARIRRIAKRPKALLSAALAALLIAALAAGCTFTAATDSPEADTPTDTLSYLGEDADFPDADSWEFQYDVDLQRFQGVRMWVEIWQDGQREVLSDDAFELTDAQGNLSIALQELGDDYAVRTITPYLSAGGASLAAQSCDLPEGDFPARVFTNMGAASDEQPYTLTPDSPLVLACAAYQPAEQETIAGYDCTTLTQEPARLADYRFAVVYKAVFTAGDPLGFELPASTAVYAPAPADSEGAEAAYAASLIQNGEETPLEINSQLLQDVIFNSLVRSAAWPNEQPVDAYPYAIRIRETIEDSARDYYACRLNGAAILMGPNMYTSLSEELMTRLEAAAGLLPGGAYTLDEAVSDMILRVYALHDVQDGQQATEAHVILGTEEADDGAVTAYVDGMYLVYSNQNGRLVQDGVGGHMPMAFTFEQDATGAYQCREVWRCQDGDYYAPSIREKFPPALAELALDSQRLAYSLTQACHAQAVAALGIDAYAEIERLMSIVCPIGAGPDYTYRDAPDADYRELVFYGDDTLNYAIDRMLDGNVAEPEASILWQLIHAIHPGEVELFDSPASDGQTEFDEWADYVARMVEGNGEEWYAGNRTACTLIACRHARAPDLSDSVDMPALDDSVDFTDSVDFHHPESHHDEHH